jgi:hypothetical protein
MLKINPDPEFTESVDITVPGKKKPVTVSFTFKYRTRVEVIAFWEVNKDKKYVEIIPEIITGWSGFDAEYNQQNLETFLDNYTSAALEIINAYQGLLLESRVKN